MKACNLSASERAALVYLDKHGPAPLSAVGYSILDAVPPSTDRKARPSPQGVALFAGRFVRALTKRNLAGQAKFGWCITREGRAYLATHEAEALGDKGDGK